MAPSGPVRVPLGHQETFSALCFDSGARVHAHLDASNAERATVRAYGASLTGDWPRCASLNVTTGALWLNRSGARPDRTPYTIV